DLTHLEAGDLNAEIEPEQRKVSQLLGEQTVIPGRILGQLVIGDHEGADLSWRQVIEANRRDLGHTERRRTQDTAMPADHAAIAIDEDRNIEAEHSDAFGDLSDLFLAVPTCIGWIRPQRIDQAVFD